MNIKKLTGIVLAICVAGALHTARAQTTNLTQQILQMPTFQEGLVWIGEKEPGDAENKELLEVLNHLKEAWWPAGVEQFLKDHPDSPWAASLRHDYASYCRRIGRTSMALEQWEVAWKLVKDDASPQGQKLAGSIIANWMDLLSSLGRLDQLKELVAAGNQLSFANPHDRDKFQGAKNAYFLMRAHPGIAYRCGTFALKAVGEKLQPDNHALQNLVALPSPLGGFTMATLLDLSKQYGLNLVAVSRPLPSAAGGQDLIVPSVVHWRQNHYAAILGREGDSYLVSDPTFGNARWLSAAVINEEASGDFLVPAAALTNGWPQLARNEIEKVHGMGLQNNINDGNDKGCPPFGPCPPCGMPVAWVSEPYVNLWMADEPVSYLTSRGEPVALRLSYKQRDTRPGPNDGPVANPGWNNSWFSYVALSEPPTGSCTADCMPSALSACSAAVYLPDGGEVDFAQGQSYDTETRLLLQPETPGYPLAQGLDYGNNGLRLVHADGSQDIYGVALKDNVGTRGYNRAFFLRTRHIDPHGDTTWFNYGVTNSLWVLQSVVDYDGNTNTLYYTGGVDVARLSAVTNAYGLSVHIKYDGDGNLTNIVDAAGIASSITYDANDNPTALVTLYGTTQLSVADNGLTYGVGNAGGDDNQLIDRSALIVDPTGATNLYMYRYDSEMVMSGATFSGAPANTPLGTLDDGTGSSDDGLNAVYFRNSYHWGPRQFAALSTANMTNFTSGDYLLARLRHWLQDTNDLYITGYLSVERDPSPDGSTEGLKTFYDYQGKTYAYREGTNAIPSVVAWCLPGGETHYEYKLFDSFGNVTNDITTYTLPGGGMGTRTNQFIYAGNTYTNWFGGIVGGAPDFVSANTFTVPNLLIQIIGADGSPVWSYGGFDLVSVTNYLPAAIGSNTNAAKLSWLRVLPDYATNGVGQVATTTFTGFDKVTSFTSVAGLTTTNLYNSNGFLARTIDLQIGRTNSFGYTTGGLVGAFTNELGLNLAATWDNLLRLTSVQFPDGTYVSNRYDRLDVGGTRDRLGNWTGYGHDGARHLITVTNANNAVTMFDWCGCGALTEIIDALANVTSFDYDYQSRLTGVAFPDGSSLACQYDLAGRMTNAADGAGRSLQLGYDNQGLVTNVADAFSHDLRQTTYDVRDRIAAVTDVNGVRMTNSFDLLDRIVSRLWPDGITEGFGYSASGLAFYTNRDSQVTRYGRDVAGRLVAVTNANLEATQFGYNPADEIISLLDGLNHQTTWQYNQYGWLTNKVDGLGRNAFQYAYNANGWLTNRVTPEKGGTAYAYDNVGSLKSINYPLSTNNYAYDALNRLTNMIDAVGTNSFGYTASGQLASEGNAWATESYGYSQGLRTNLIISQSGTNWMQSYSYDQAWRLTNTVSMAGAFIYNYLDARPQTPSAINLPNGAYITNNYDSLARLTQTALINHWGHTLDGYAYQVDPLGLRTNLTRNFGLTTNTVSIGYDGTGQLTNWLARETSGVPRQNEQLGWAYDAADNTHARNNGGLTLAFTSDAANQLDGITRSGTMTLSGAMPAPAANITVNGQAAQIYGDFTFAGTNLTLLNGNNTFTNIAQNIYGVKATNTFTVNLPASVTLSYDNNGNLTNDGTRTFFYDSENQLTNVFVAGQWRSDFTYDGLNRRRINRDYTWQGGAWVKTNETRIVYDGYLPIQERDTNNNVLVTYTRGLDISGSLNGAGGIGGLLARTDTNGSTFYHADGSGNVTAMMDGYENIVARYLYNPFGKLLGQWGTMAGVNVMQFSSMPQWRGISLYPRRAYLPELARFSSSDPIQESGGVNLYRTFRNNPLNFVDPLGFQPAPGGGVESEPNVEVRPEAPIYPPGTMPDDERMKEENDLLNNGPPSDTSIGPIPEEEEPKPEKPEQTPPQKPPCPQNSGGGIGNQNSPPNLAISPYRQLPPGSPPFYHYGYGEDAPGFQNGLRPGGFATTDPNLTGPQAQSGLALPPRLSPPDSVYPVTPAPGTWVRANPVTDPANGQPGGLPEYQFPGGTGPGTVGPPSPVPK